jgi:cob(I)alamin adenosyltransferase
MQQAGQQNVQAGGLQGEFAKIDSYKNSATKNVQKLVADIQNDLTKLGVQIDTKKMQSFSKSMTTSLMKALDIFKGQVGQAPVAQQSEEDYY